MIRSIEVGVRGEVFALVIGRGVFRRDGSGRWQHVLDDPEAGLGDIYERDDGTLLLTTFVSGPVYWSMDRGERWQRSGSVQPLAHLLANREYGNTHSITAAGEVFALSGDGLHWSRDGGQAWDRMAMPAGAPQAPLNLQAICADDRRVYFVDGGTLWRSDDRGHHWEIIVPQVPAESPIMQRESDAPLTLRMDADGVLYALGSPAADQSIDVSRDGGSTWKRERFGSPEDAAFVWHLFAGEWSRGVDGADAVHVLERGEIPGVDMTFRKVSRVAGGYIDEIHYPGSRIAVLVGDARGTLFLTTMSPLDAYESIDRGHHWTLVARDGID